MFNNLIEALRYFDENKIALENLEGNSYSYGDVLRLCENFKKFCIGNNIDNSTRIHTKSEELLKNALLGLAVFDYCTLCPINTELSDEQIKNYFKILKVDYILTDEPYGRVYELAVKMGLGVIKFSLFHEDGFANGNWEIIKEPKNKVIKPKYDSRIAFVSTTSGTTSTPKIVPVTYESNIIGNNNMNSYYGFTEDSHTVMLRKAYRGSFISGIVRSILTGSKIFLLNGFNHKEIIYLIKEKDITWFTAAPVVLLSFADYIKRNNINIFPNKLNFIRSSGAPLNIKDKKLLESIFKTEIVITYGITEANKLTTTYKAPKGYKKDSVGLSIGPRLKISDDEILISGPTVFPGYENSDIKRNEYLTDDNWYKTGDLGYIDDDGYVFITGRIKEMINKGGEKVSPYEVEKIVLETFNFKKVYVFPYPNEIGSENVGLAVVENGNQITGLKEVRNRIEGKISAFKMPSLLLRVNEIPVGEEGKIQRKTLHKKILEMSAEEYYKEDLNDIISKKVVDKKYNEVEFFLIKTWKNLLKVKNISIKDNFFEIGGDSLAAAATLSEIEHKYKVQIPINTFFKMGTAESIATYINSNQKKKIYDFIVPVKETGFYEPLFCIHTSDGEAVSYHNIGKYINENIPVYALRFNINKKWNHPLTFKEMSVRYVDEILDKQPEGSYHLMGRCYGGVLALKVAEELTKRGKIVKEVLMLDSPDLNRLLNNQKNIEDNVYFKKWLNSVNQFKNKKKVEIPKLILKKSFSLFRLTKDKIRYPVYKLGLNLKNDILIKLGGKEAALSMAFRINKQRYYAGTVYYFKANLDKISSGNRVEYWKSMVNNFNVVEMETYHNEMDNEESMKYIAEKTSLILEGIDEKVYF